MKDALLRAAVSAVLGWTRLYTTRLPPALRDRRYEEIQSDLWESTHDRPQGAGMLPLQLLARLVIGIPDDLRWRHEHSHGGREGAAPMARRWALAMTVAAIGVLAFWLTREMREPEMAEVLRLLPPEPAEPRLIDVPPPPPPPPPPCLPDGFPRSPGPCTR